MFYKNPSFDSLFYRIQVKELTRDEKSFIKKLSSFITQRALHFQEVAKEM